MFSDQNHVNSPVPMKGLGFYTPPANCKLSTPKRCMSENNKLATNFHVMHKVPAGDSPYVIAKRVQLIEKDPGRAIPLFWGAINSGDRVDSALKDMAVVMKQLDRSDEAIEAIKSFRHLCSPASQESLDNVLVELYKRSGRLEEQIEILQQKLKLVEQGNAFGGKRLKLARSQGKKVHITVEQEYARLLGNLAWAYLQQSDYKSAEEYYRKALSLEVDRNMQCNLAVCLMYMNRINEARFLLRVIQDSACGGQMDESYEKSYERASQLLAEIVSQPVQSSSEQHEKENCPARTRRVYTPPNPPRRIPRSPFTQPRGDSMLLKSGDWSRGTYWNEPINRSYRRLQFEKPATSDFPPSRDSERSYWERPSGSLTTPMESTAMQEPHDKTVLYEDRQKVLSATDSSPHKLGTSTSGGRTSEISGGQNGDEQDFPIYNGKKSWADMVEEEEQDLTAENVDLNMVAPLQNPQSPVENMNSKFRSFGLNDQPSARRSLSFTQEQKKDPVEFKRGTRLKVFQDITP